MILTENTRTGMLGVTTGHLVTCQALREAEIVHYEIVLMLYLIGCWVRRTRLTSASKYHGYASNTSFRSTLSSLILGKIFVCFEI